MNFLYPVFSCVCMHMSGMFIFKYIYIYICAHILLGYGVWITRIDTVLKHGRMKDSE